MKRSRKEWVKKEVDIVKREFTSESPRKIIQNILSIFLGACISAFGDSLFTIPRNIVSGGIASLSILFLGSYSDWTQVFSQHACLYDYLSFDGQALYL